MSAALKMPWSDRQDFAVDPEEMPDPLQAMLLDVLTTTTHGVVNPQLAMVPYGRLLLSPALASKH